MDANRLRQLAGLQTESKPKITEGFDSLRKMAGINTPVSTSPASLSISANDIRRLAGLPAIRSIPEAEEKSDTPPEENTTPTDVEQTPEAEEDSQPAIIKKIATHLEGKSVEEIEAMLMKVYDAGKADAEKAAEEEVPTGEEVPTDGSSESEEIGLEPGEE